MARHRKFRSYDLLDVFEVIHSFYVEKGLLKRFELPYHFLEECCIGYINEEEYTQRAKALVGRLGIGQRDASLSRKIFKKAKILFKGILLCTLQRA